MPFLRYGTRHLCHYLLRHVRRLINCWKPYQKNIKIKKAPKKNTPCSSFEYVFVKGAAVKHSEIAARLESLNMKDVKLLDTEPPVS